MRPWLRSGPPAYLAPVGGASSARSVAEDCLNACDGAFEILLDLKVPEAQDRPPGCVKFGVNPAITSHVVLDLLVPVLAGSSGTVPRWMAVPKRAINEHGYSAPRPS